MNATHNHFRSTLVSLLIAICMTLAATGTAAAAQHSTMSPAPKTTVSSTTAQPTSHVTEQRHTPRVVAYADGSLKHHRTQRRHVVAYAD